MAGQNFAHGSTMDLVRPRQVANGVTSKIGSYQPRLFSSVEAVLGLDRVLSRDSRIRLVE
jgi:hypothetical protein